MDFCSGSEIIFESGVAENQLRVGKNKNVMNLILKDGLKTHLLREALIENEQLHAQFSALVNSDAADEENGMGKSKAPEKSGIGRNKEIVKGPIVFPTLLETQCLQLPFDIGTNAFKSKATAIRDRDTPFYKMMSSVNRETGEINVASVEGQLFGVAYSGTAGGSRNETCGGLSKTIRLSQPYPFPVLVVAMTKCILPENPDAVMYIDQGNIPVPVVAAEGNLINMLTTHQNGNWFSSTERVRFLHKVTFGNATFFDSYRSQITIVNDIQLNPDTTEFVYSTRAHIAASTNRRFDNIGELDIANYGLAMIDFRNKERGNETPIAMRPFTDELTFPAGGIKISEVCFEVYKAG